MLDNLGWRLFENRRIDFRQFMFYIQIPEYFEKPHRYTHHMLTLSFIGRHILLQHTTSSLSTEQPLYSGIEFL